MPPALPPTQADLTREGEAARGTLPRSAQGEFPPQSRDAVAIIEEQNASRLPHLVPLRMARMTASPYAFFRGSAAIMARDLGALPHTDIHVVACGDAHLSNFGVFATPDHRLTFELNDFDEACTAPWEWDVKRLATSIILASRERGTPDDDAMHDVREAVRGYQSNMARMMALNSLERTFARVDIGELVAKYHPHETAFLQHAARHATHKTVEEVLPRITTRTSGGQLRIVDDLPVTTHLPHLTLEVAQDLKTAYMRTMRMDSAFLLRQFHLVDIVFRVVGVGSVGTRCMLLLLTGPSGEPLFLQVKEAVRSVLEQFGGAEDMLRASVRPDSDHEGFRVINCQRILQTAPDPFLGNVSHDGHDYYVRQFLNMKASVDLDNMSAGEFRLCCRLCGELLARSHAQSPASPFIHGYLGEGDTFPEAIAQWAVAYAGQVETDFAALQAAVASGRVATASKG
ncbi:MAG: DUF2252 domain-containing protein [Thermomicrobiales bacterium]